MLFSFLQVGYFSDLRLFLFNMSEERELIEIRSSYEERLTAFSNYISNLQEPLTLSQVSELKIQVSNFDILYDKYDEVQLKLECLVDDIDNELNERTRFESVYFKVIAQAKELILRNNKCAASCSDVCNNKPLISARALPRPFIKVPAIRLTKFSGLSDNWLEFRDLFSSLVHFNNDIDDLNKFIYLRESLEGTAAAVIQAIELCASNYSIAWALLCDQFGNKRLLIRNNHITTLFNNDLILCPYCNCDHYLDNCPKFLDFTYEQRMDLLAQLKVCCNCLRSRHYANHIEANGCKDCNKLHNIVIHVSDLRHSPKSNVCLNVEERPLAPATHGDLPTGIVTPSAQTSTHLSTKSQVPLAPYLNHFDDRSSNSCLITEQLRRSTVLKENYCFELPIITNIELRPQLLLTDLNLLSKVSSHNYCDDDIQTHLKRFWRHEMVSRKSSTFSYNEKMCGQTINLCNDLLVLFDSRPGRLVSGSAHNSGQAPHSILNLKSNRVTVNSNNNVSSLNYLTIFNNDTQTHLKEFRRLEEVSHKSLMCDETIKACLIKGRSVQCKPMLNKLGSGHANDSGHAPCLLKILKSEFVIINFNNKIISHNKFYDDIQTRLKWFRHLQKVSRQSSPCCKFEKFCSKHSVIFTSRQSDVWCCVNIQLPQSPDVSGGSPTTTNCLLCFLIFKLRFKGHSNYKNNNNKFLLKCHILDLRHKVSIELASAGMKLRMWKSNEVQINLKY